MQKFFMREFAPCMVKFRFTRTGKGYFFPDCLQIKLP